MITDLLCRFLDDTQPNAHDLFQAWRREYPDGCFLNLKTSTSAILHQQGRCKHPGNTEWLRSELEGSLTLKEKVCSPFVDVLLAWAKAQGVRVTPCKHCNTPASLNTTFVAYHKRNRGPFPAPADDEEIGFETGKKLGELSKAFGALTWIISGKKSASRQRYYLHGYYLPNRVETEEDSAYLTGPGQDLDEPLEITDEPWLAGLLRDQMNFHRGTGTALSDVVSLDILRFVLRHTPGA